MNSGSTAVDVARYVVPNGITLVILAAVIYGIVKTRGTPRLLLAIAGGLTVLASVSGLSVPFLALSFDYRSLPFVLLGTVPSMLRAGAFVCLVLAVVKATQQRSVILQPGAPAPYLPGQPAPYPPGQSAPYPPGQSAPYPPGQSAPYPPGQSVTREHLSP